MSAIKPLSENELSALMAWLKDVGKVVDSALDDVLPVEDETFAENPVWACMRYAALSGGKRLRPALVMAAYEMLVDENERVEHRAALVGAAMEMIHAYSLIQDDMPCMDNDTLRRGQPTAHVKFGEMVALLASDGLQTGAYEVLAGEGVHPDPAVRVALVKLFAVASGAKGMVAGQMADMAYERQGTKIGVDDIWRMNRLKTGVNLEACAVAGALLADAGDEVRVVLEAYGRHVGRAFQVWDDVLDVTASSEVLGKTAGKDVAAGKSTFVSLLGLEKARQAAWDEAAAAIAAVRRFGVKADKLELLARYTVTREK